jgi:hypothetical protein
MPDGTLYIFGMSLANLVELREANPTAAHPPPTGTSTIVVCEDVGKAPERWIVSLAPA